MRRRRERRLLVFSEHCFLMPKHRLTSHVLLHDGAAKPLHIFLTGCQAPISHTGLSVSGQCRSDAGNVSMGSKGNCGIIKIYVRLVSYLG